MNFLTGFIYLLDSVSEFQKVVLFELHNDLDFACYVSSPEKDYFGGKFHTDLANLLWV